MASCTLKGHTGDRTGLQLPDTLVTFSCSSGHPAQDLTLGPLHKPLPNPLFSPPPPQFGAHSHLAINLICMQSFHYNTICLGMGGEVHNEVTRRAPLAMSS